MHDLLHLRQITEMHVTLDMLIELPLHQIFGDKLQGLTFLQQLMQKELQVEERFDVRPLQLLLQVMFAMLQIHTNL